MASNREERQQMRQRGAGTRKIKEVDFGFSLGFGPTPEEPSQSASQPTNTEINPAPAPQAPSINAPPPPYETATTEPPRTQTTSSPTRVNSSSQEQPSQRTPGSARNKLPPRPSTFDIPADEELDLGRDSKRRKIESPKPIPPSIGAQPEIQNLEVADNGNVEQLIIPQPDEGVTIPIRTATNPEQLRDQEPPGIPSIPADEPNEAPPTFNEDGHLEIVSTEHATQAVPEPPRANGTTSPSSHTTKSRGRGRGRKANLSPSQSEVSNPEPTKDDARTTEPPAPRETIQEQESSTETEPPQPQREKRLRSRTPASARPSTSPPLDKASVENESSEQVPSDKPTSNGLRGRKRKNLETMEKGPRRDSNESATIQVETEVEPTDDVRKLAGPSQEQPNGIDKGKKRAGRPKKMASRSPVSVETSGVNKRQREEQEPTPEQEVEPSRPGKRKQRGRQPEHTREEEPEPEAEFARAAKRRKQREEREQERNQQQEPAEEREEPESEPSRAGRRKHGQLPEPTREEEQPEPEVEPSRAGKRKRQRGRQQEQVEEQEEQEPEAEIEPEPEPPAERERAKGTKRRGRPPTQPEKQPTQDETTEERPQTTKQRTRQPRGVTVPVTVHRLANAASLRGERVHESASEDEAGSSDEISNNQPAKLPTRGGVNAADVLSQICRETLEKTLTTLKNGIASEANTARRAEWTLRRKAVEAFSTELESRLFELSEMLDSNFMLGVKLKKAKRNMMDRRNRLDQLRREREAVALKMDAVRREHMREEQASLSRSTINHSLHNLDLALERGQSRTTEDEQLTAGLEFRLRNVAQNVSSTAPGAQGGLLHQIKMFNAQLETVRGLEG
ncbi:hypothetical protein BDW59DRAFT_149360 [Aspergillus cavernicola]|uniref:Inner kinetochore subunit AME1 domain-containing protein n=1 Tax=Aspergillus cavernicola TaxID=176166 RepID=A0ABR4I4P2_9EURO